MDAFLKIMAFSLFLSLSVAQGFAAAPPRIEISLNGDWLVQKVEDLSAPPKGEWKPFQVPNYLSGANYERAWLKRSFDADTAWAGKRIKLHFGGVKFNSSILVNGKKVGGNLGGYEPFEVDVTDVVKFGSSNELLVGVHDWTGVFSQKVDLSEVKNWDELRHRPKDALLSPIGGLFALYGIWEEVTLRVLPPVYVKDMFVKTSVRKKRIEAEVTIANESDAPHEVTVKGQVFDPGESKSALDLPEGKVTVKPGESQTITLSEDWPNPKLWSHLSPHLYELKIELAGVASDSCSTRFGFREFWAEKDAFYLNGTKINLLATSTWPQHKIVDRAYIEDTYRAVKEANCVAFRLHTQPWQKLYYDIADEMGLLIVVEGAVWCDQNYRFTDPQWWENYATHLHRTVGQLKNHPSIIMWSLENEILACAQGSKESPAKDGLASLGRLVKKWDSTRLIFYESDLDPRGVADVIGIHYPYPEYPRVNQYPNCCYWMDGEIPMKRPLVEGERELWKWNRKKPLYIGEFLWVPARDPSVDTIFYGDETYSNFGKYHALAKAAAWRMQIEAYRWYGVNGICPWTMFEGPGGVLAQEKNPLWLAVRDTFQPNAAFVKEYDTRFYAGDEVTRTLTAYNDTFSDGDFTLSWSFSCGATTVANGDKRMKLKSATHRTISVRFRAPTVTEPTDAQFKIALLREGNKVCFEDTKQYRIYPRSKMVVSTPCVIACYDPAGSVTKVLAEDGVAFQKTGSLAEIPMDVNVLIIGAHALKAESKPGPEPLIGQANPDRERLMEFVRGGGRVLVLAQREFPGNLLPPPLSDYASTITFPLAPRHPILAGITADDLKFWRGDHLVSERELLRPTTGGGEAIVVSGSGSGLSHSPLMELRRGKGVFVLCQMRIMEKLATEPVAKRILQNILNYLATYSAEARLTCLISGSQDFKDLLRGLRLRFADLTGKLGKSDLAQYGLLISSGDVKEVEAQQEKIRSYLESGGRALFHCLTPEAMEKLGRIFPRDVALQSHRGRVGWINESDPLTSGWTRESLYWLGKHEGPGHARTPLADGVADFAVVSRKPGGPAILQLKAADMTLEGHLAHKVEDHVGLFTNGSLAKEIEVPEDGRYGITITAKGTPAAAVWPLMEVAVDGEVVDVVSVPSRDWMTLTVAAGLKKGARSLKVSFINDYNKDKEDRNLFVKQVEIAKMPVGTEGFVGLTRPAFVARFDVGKGYAVVDEVTWDTESRNAQKALQYAQGLLTSLGADFEDPCCDVVGPDEMREDKTMAHFNRAADHVCLASAGYVTVAAKFATGGRYTLEIVARGTPLDNIYPIVDVLIDGAKVATIGLKSDGWRSYPLDVDLAQGEHEIKLVYTNDAYRPPEDRNLYIQKIAACKLR